MNNNMGSVIEFRTAGSFELDPATYTLDKTWDTARAFELGVLYKTQVDVYSCAEGLLLFHATNMPWESWLVRPLNSGGFSLSEYDFHNSWNLESMRTKILESYGDDFKFVVVAEEEKEA